MGKICQNLSEHWFKNRLILLLEWNRNRLQKQKELFLRRIWLKKFNIKESHLTQVYCFGAGHELSIVILFRERKKHIVICKGVQEDKDCTGQFC